MREQAEKKDRIKKINELLDKLDEKLVFGEITEAQYKQLYKKYRVKAELLEDYSTEASPLGEVVFKARTETKSEEKELKRKMDK